MSFSWGPTTVRNKWVSVKRNSTVLKLTKLRTLNSEHLDWLNADKLGANNLTVYV